MLCGGMTACHRCGVCTVRCVECDALNTVFVIKYMLYAPLQHLLETCFAPVIMCLASCRQCAPRYVCTSSCSVA